MVLNDMMAQITKTRCWVPLGQEEMAGILNENFFQLIKNYFLAQSELL